MELKWIKVKISEKNYQDIHIYRIRNRFRNLSEALDDVLNKFLGGKNGKKKKSQ